MIHAHYLLALKKLVLKNLIYFGFSSALEILYWVKKIVKFTVFFLSTLLLFLINLMPKTRQVILV